MMNLNKLNKQYKSVGVMEFRSSLFFENKIKPKLIYEITDHYIRLLNRNGNRSFYTFHNFDNFNKDLPEYFRKWYMDDNHSIGCYESFKLKDRMLEVFTREKNGKYFARMVVSDISDFGNCKTLEVVERRVG